MKTSSVMPARISKLQEDMEELETQKAAQSQQQARIIFKELHGDIQARKGVILSLQRQQNELLEVDERGKVNIAAENKQRAQEIATKLKKLRDQNETEISLLEKSNAIASKYNVDFDELHLLNLSIPMLERQISELDTAINRILAVSPERLMEKDSKHSELGQKFEMLNRAREALKNHQAAKKEINELLREK